MSADPILVHRVFSRLNVGGPAMHVVDLARKLDDGQPFRTRLVVGRIEPTEGDMGWYAEERGVEPTVIPTLRRALHPLDDLRTFFALLRLFRDERPHVVHTHTSKAGFLGRVAAWLAGVPVRVHTYHGHVLGGAYFGALLTALFRTLERWTARITHRLVVLTEAQKGEMAGRLGIAPEEKFAVVPLGLDLEPFAAVDRNAVRAEARREVGLGPEDRVVGIVGRLVPVKNHELLFDAVSPLVERLERGEGPGRGTPPEPGREGGGSSGRGQEPGSGPGPVRVLVVGSGEREEELRRYARARGIEDRVIWLGWRRDLPRLYPAIDVLALPSHDEGTPVAVIEALAARIPVVARDVGGVSEVLEGGRWGALVRRPDAGELAARLADLLLDPPGADRLEAASRSVRARFSVERLAGDVKTLYRELLP